MCQNESAIVIHALNNFQCRKCFSKSHFCIPEHLMTSTRFFELLNCLFDSFRLFWSENYRTSICSYFTCIERCSSFFRSCNCFLYSFKVSIKPFICFMFCIKNFSFNTRTYKNVMNIMILENYKIFSFHISSSFGI